MGFVAEVFHILYFNYYIAGTPSVEVYTLHLFTDSGHIQFDCWDTNPGQENPGGLRDGYL
jgi:hypothetical protein